MSSSYRSWEEREAEATKTRAEAALLAAQAEAAKQDLGTGAAKTATEQLAEQVKQARLRKQLTAVEDDAADDQAQRDERRREAALDKGVFFKKLVAVIFVLGLLASLPSLTTYFLDLRAEGGPDRPAWYLLPVPLFLELLAFTAVKGAQWAVRKGFARWPFWILTATLAGFAGFINGAKGAELFGPIAGLALAATSVVGPVLVEVREIIEARSAGDNRDAVQRAADKAKARAEAAVAKEKEQREKRQDADRKAMFPEQHEVYLKILASVPAGSMDRDEAWKEAGAAVRFPDVHDRMLSLISLPGAPSRPEAFAASWRDLYGGPLGVTANVLDRRLKAEADLASVLEAAEVTPERIAVDRLLADLFPTRTGGDDGPAMAAPKRGPQGPSKTPGALGGIEKRPSGRQPRADATEPLKAEDIEKATKFRDAVPPAQFSTPAVAKLLGRSKVYARRVRDAVQPEQS
ncbi:hypothetical protein [Streptomyces sp. WAC08241]|uniref:hypothetical protein n=1 Tax=Streptomyces sp. WAC08241 TaxID=2487421 RepID=UPI000F79F8ED|nr:hypothetical protein [Streptomyces sp. WAC08241]RSS38902.1 hypothetical protein EF906_19995 [Streptomyces sp. WAC08241]